MFIVFVSLLVVVAAAPQYLHQSIHHGPGYYQDPGFYRPGYHRHHHRGFFDDDNDFFDTRSFWNELSTEMRNLDNYLADFNRRFPTTVSQAVIEDNQYKITIPLVGYEDKDIVVKARQGLLMVQAVHKIDETILNNYLDVRTLPDCVNPSGSWAYEKNVLKITFPLKEDAAEDKDKTVTEAPVFEVSTESREEIEPSGGSNIVDADVGLKRGDQVETEIEHMLKTNEVPNNEVEATTYAVDITGDVEFVPVQYKSKKI